MSNYGNIWFYSSDNMQEATELLSGSEGFSDTALNTALVNDNYFYSLTTTGEKRRKPTG